MRCKKQKQLPSPFPVPRSPNPHNSAKFGHTARGSEVAHTGHTRQNLQGSAPGTQCKPRGRLSEATAGVQQVWRGVGKGGDASSRDCTCACSAMWATTVGPPPRRCLGAAWLVIWACAYAHQRLQLCIVVCQQIGQTHLSGAIPDRTPAPTVHTSHEQVREPPPTVHDL